MDLRRGTDSRGERQEHHGVAARQAERHPRHQRSRRYCIQPDRVRVREAHRRALGREQIVGAYYKAMEPPESVLAEVRKKNWPEQLKERACR